MNDTATVIATSGLSKRYGRTWGLQDCTFNLPRGRIAALVGPNGSGKSTLLRMAAGITRPSAGEIRVLGSSPLEQPRDVLARIGYLDQERPLYKTFRVSEMLRVGKELNRRWDDAKAHEYLEDLGIPLASRIGKLSVGQQAQVSLTLCLAKRPELLLLDEPVAALDPLARSQLMQVLLGSVTDEGTTVLLSSHALADLDVVCDYLIILSSSRVLLAGDLESLRAEHRLLVGPRRDRSNVPAGAELVSATDTERQSTWLLRAIGSITAPGSDMVEPTLEEIVLAYLRQQPAGSHSRLAGSRDLSLADDPLDSGEQVRAR